MEINYSSLDTIEKYSTLFQEFPFVESHYLKLNSNRQLIDFSAGLSLTNSIHERFIKSIVEEYSKIYTLENTRKNEVIKQYKTPKSIKAFVNLLNLSTKICSSFDFHKSQLPQPNTISDFENLVTIICEQRNIRNDYLHGDFNFSDKIIFSTFNDNIVRFHKYHIILFKIIRYAFIENTYCLPKKI